MIYNFPRARFVDENTPGQQLDHAVSEVDEIHDALQDPDTPFDDAVMEIADLTHSLETYWRIMEAQHGKAYVKRIIDRVVRKNEKRGYYRG